jgi:hypothetical protein
MYDLREKVEKLRTEAEKLSEQNRELAKAGFTANGEITASFVYASFAHDLGQALAETEEAFGEDLLD